MKQSKWIWKPGDFELYHSMLLHNRITHQGLYYPPMWRVDAPARNVLLYKKAELTETETLTVYSNTKQASFLVNSTRYPVGTTVTLEPGKYFIKLSGFKPDGFPAFYCVGDTFASDETWRFGSFGARDAFAGSIATADVLIARTVKAGFSLPDAVRMMTETPARVMGLSSKGRIAKGYDADFTVLDRNLCVSGRIGRS